MINRPGGVARSLIFDGNEYTERLLRPIRIGSVLPSLVDRYALDRRHLNMADREVLGWIEQVVILWRRQADQGVATIAEACVHLLEEDEGLRRAPGYREAEWWREKIRAAKPADDSPARHRVVGTLGEPRRETAQEQAPGAAPSHAPQPPTDPRTPQVPDAPARADDRPSSANPASGAGAGQSSSAVLDLTSEQRDDRVIIRWQAPRGVSNAMGFIVERQGPGTERRRWRVSGTVFEDRDPPAGQRVVYRVAMQDSEQGVSSGVRVSVIFTPPVSGIVTQQVSSGVVGRWRPRQEVSETRVWRTIAGSSTDSADSEPVQSRVDGFHDGGVPPGQYVYSVIPVYRHPDGQTTYPGTCRRVPVEVVEWRPPPTPRVVVDEIQRGAAQIALRWDQLPSGTSLLLRRVAEEPTGAPGDVLTVENACRVGESVEGGVALEGNSARLTLPAGHWLLVPFSVAGTLAVRGHSLAVVIVPPVSNPEAVRDGPNVQVSWEWPEGVSLARVVWRTSGAELPREVTYSEYHRLGFVAFRSSETTEAEISGVFRSGSGELRSTPVTAAVAAQTPTLTFHVHRVWPWQLRRIRPYRPHGLHWYCATRRIIFTADLPCTGLRLEVCVRSPGDGPGSEVRVRVIEDLDLGPDRPHEVTLTIPDLNSTDRQHYLACRAETMSGPVRVNEYASTGREIRPCFR